MKNSRTSRLDRAPNMKGLHYWHDRAPAEPERSRIIAGLLELRRQDFLQGVWIDNDVIRVRRAVWDLPSRLPWSRASLLLSQFEKQGGRVSSALVDLL